MKQSWLFLVCKYLWGGEGKVVDVRGRYFLSCTKHLLISDAKLFMFVLTSTAFICCASCIINGKLHRLHKQATSLKLSRSEWDRADQKSCAQNC